MDLNASFLLTLVSLQSLETLTKREQRRVRIALYLYNRPVNFSAMARELVHSRKTIARWYYRLREANENWHSALQVALGTPGHAGEALRKQRLARQILDDAPRSGAPCTYSPEQYTQIIALALEKPATYQRPITHWTARELTDEVHRQGIAPGISARQVWRFLQQADLQPHRSRYWLNPKIDDQEEFEQTVRSICALYHDAKELSAEGTHLVSVDEKTSIQALERVAPTKPMRQGRMERIEAEYQRHGTLCLIPSFDVATGRIVQSYIGQTRNEDDFASHITATVAADPDARWIFVVDQLNTHMSETLVKLVAKMVGYTGELGKKGRRGVLHTMATRKAFLQDLGHRIRFVYTPKHCSWLNQVEIWFSILSRKVLKRGNFRSKEELRKTMSDFIEYFNRTMAKPFKWTCKGLPLMA